MRGLFRLIVAGLLIVALAYGLMGWARGPVVDSPSLAEAVPAVDLLPVDRYFVDMPNLYRCGEGSEAYPVRLSDADRIIIEAMHDGRIQTPWRIVGCAGLSDEEKARRKGE